jgi:hypothetical protein
VFVEHPVALYPWQAPVTWRELRAQLSVQGVDLGALLRKFGPRLRDHEVPLEKRPGRLLLLGFPIPNKVGEGPRRVHWVAVEMPPLSAGENYARGFRKGERGYVRRDMGLFQGDQRLRWVPSQCWEKDELSGRGRLGSGLRARRIALLGAGALGSAVAEILVRGGVDDLTIFDADALEAGNLVRHTLGLGQVGANKAEALARRLDEAAPSATIHGIGRAFPDPLVDCDRMEVVLDATGEDDVLVHLERYPWTHDRWFASLWVGLHADRVYCFTSWGTRFPAELCRQLFEPWRLREGREYSGEEPPRPGIGCWHPVFPAGAADIGLAASTILKYLDGVLASGRADPTLAVFEQSKEPDSPGIRRVQ